jgi:MoxR-like ATPase
MTLLARAQALLEGRLAPGPDDVLRLARPVLSHRMALSFAARAEGLVLEEVIDGVAATVIRAPRAA